MRSMYIFSSLPIIFLLVLLSGCGEQKTAEEATIVTKQDDDDLSLPFDQRLKKYVERKLNTRPEEHYRLKIYEEHLNDDGEKDILITVNRYENAIKTAEEKNLVTKSATVGFFGNHNYMIYYSSKTNRFSEPMIVASTPQRELTISFENISSENYKDIVVDYPIRNSQFRRIYLMMDDKPYYVFQWKRYDGWGTDKIEAYCFEYGTGSYSEVKDIIINRADMKNIGKEDDYDTIEPEITCTGQLIKRFFFNTQDRKYYTPN